jgi:hypothetical protein
MNEKPAAEALPVVSHADGLVSLPSASFLLARHGLDGLTPCF